MYVYMCMYWAAPGYMYPLSDTKCSPRLCMDTPSEYSGCKTIHKIGTTLISIMTVCFFLDKKNSSSNSGAKAHRFGLCSQRSVSM